MEETCGRSVLIVTLAGLGIQRFGGLHGFITSNGLALLQY